MNEFFFKKRFVQAQQESTCSSLLAAVLQPLAEDTASSSADNDSVALDVWWRWVRECARDLQCLYRLLLVLKRSPQLWHGNGRSPVCVRTCFCRTDGLAHTRPQNLQVCRRLNLTAAALLSLNDWWPSFAESCPDDCIPDPESDAAGILSASATKEGH